MRQFILPLVPILILSPLQPPAQAQSPAPAALEPVHMSYSAYAAGLNVINLDADFDSEPRSYRVDLAFRTAGVFGMVIHSTSFSTVSGVWKVNHAAPETFTSEGVLRGEPHRTLIEYQGGNPQVRILEPPAAQERDVVPPEMQRGTVDTLSALAELLQTITSTGRCDGAATTFDGRRLSEIRVHTAGTVKLAPESRTMFSGETLQCDFEGRQTGGFDHDADRTELEKPQHGSAWVARVVPGGPLIPVRMSFHTRFFGQATMYLTAAGPGLMAVNATSASR